MESLKPNNADLIIPYPPPGAATAAVIVPGVDAIPWKSEPYRCNRVSGKAGLG